MPYGPRLDEIMESNKEIVQAFDQQAAGNIVVTETDQIFVNQLPAVHVLDKILKSWVATSSNQFEKFSPQIFEAVREYIRRRSKNLCNK